MRKLLLLGMAILCVISISAQDSLGVEKLYNFKFADGINDIWGYTDSTGNEYALVGVNTGFSIVDVTIPTAPVQSILFKEQVPYGEILKPGIIMHTLCMMVLGHLIQMESGLLI